METRKREREGEIKVIARRNRVPCSIFNRRTLVFEFAAGY